MAARKRALTIAAAVAATTILTSANASITTKADNSDSLNLGSSWVGGVAPGSDDIADWDAITYTNVSYTLGGDLSWLGMNVRDSVDAISFNAGNTLTIGSAGITTVPVTTSNKSFVFNNPIALSADQTWNIGSRNGTSGSNSLILNTTSGLDTAGHRLTLAGRGTKDFRSNIIGGGDLIIGPSEVLNSTNVTKFTNAANAGMSNVTVTAANQYDASNGITTLNFNGNAGGADRVKSLSLEGAGSSSGVALTVDQNSTSANTVDTVANALTIEPGFAAVQIRAKSTQNAQLAIGSLDRRAGSTLLLAGLNLAANNVGTGTNSSNITFTTAPTLTGGSGSAGESTIGIIKGAFGDTSYTGSQTGPTATSGLATYDAAKGVRLLSASEYTNAIIDGQTSLDNVQLANSSGTGIVTTTLDSDTTVNSLSFSVSGANTTSGSGIAISGAGTLKLNSGVIYASQLVTGQPTSGNTNNKMLISVPTLDLNGQEGIIIGATNSINSSGSHEGGYLELSSVISNDGGHGLTIGGSGVVKFSGTSANTYTGVTTVNGGILYLGAGASSSAVPGDLVLNGGAVEDGSNTIADTSNITINGGSFKLQLGNEGSSRSETFNNLTMTGGRYSTGSSNHAGSSTITGTATLQGGTMGFAAQTNVSVAGLTTLSGGLVTIANANSTSTYNTCFSANGGLAISNIASGSYTPITINGSATNKGGKLTLGGDLTFTGNAANSNTVTIAAPTNTNMGIIDLNGATRTFNIGNGAAADDLTVNPVIDNGGLTKSGAGKLVLGAANTYTGPTTIMGGELKLGASGSIASALIDVSAGATFDTTNLTTLAMSGAQTVKFEIDPAGAGSAGLLSAAGLDITNGVVDFGTAGSLDDAAYILASYTGLTGSSFNTVNNQPSGYTLNYNYQGNHQIALVMVPEPGTVALAVLTGGVALMLRRRSHVAEA